MRRIDETPTRTISQCRKNDNETIRRTRTTAEVDSADKEVVSGVCRVNARITAGPRVRRQRETRAIAAAVQAYRPPHGIIAHNTIFVRTYERDRSLKRRIAVTRVFVVATKYAY